MPKENEGKGSSYSSPSSSCGSKASSVFDDAELIAFLSRTNAGKRSFESQAF